MFPPPPARSQYLVLIRSGVFFVLRGYSGGWCWGLWGIRLWVSQRVSLQVRLAYRLGGRGGFPLALANTLEVFWCSLGRGEEEAAGHLVERGVLLVFHPDNPRFPLLDLGDGAHLGPWGTGCGLWCPRGVVCTPPPLWGGLCWGQGWPFPWYLSKRLFWSS